MANYKLRVLVKKRDYGMWVLFALFWAFFVFFPWKCLGIKPLWFGWIPNWLGVASIFIIIYVIIWLIFFGKRR
jgi:hypothetical protein